jgi:hypothetical protein
MSRHASFLLAAALAAGLAGCAATPSRQVSATPPVEMLAATTQGDIVDLMVGLYPPAHTRLALTRPAHDALGQGLVGTLRERGYAIEEPEIESRRRRPQASPGGLDFNYRLVPVHGDGLYELLVTVGKTRLSRVYALGGEGNALVPGGDWARRE